MEEIILCAEVEKNKVETAFIELAQQSADPDFVEAFASITNRLDKLLSGLAAESTKTKELENRRDLDWNAYQALAQKETEIRKNLQTNSSMVLASSAVLPQVLVSRGVIRKTVIAGVFRFFLDINGNALFGRQEYRTRINNLIKLLLRIKHGFLS